MHDLVIYGAGGLGREIAEVVRRINEQHYVWNFLGFVDDALSPPAPVWEGREVLGNMDFIRTFRGPLDVVLGIGSPQVGNVRYSPKRSAQ